MSQAEDLAAIPSSLMKEYLTFGGGAYGTTTYEYEPTSYFETMNSLNEVKKRETEEDTRKRAGEL